MKIIICGGMWLSSVPFHTPHRDREPLGYDYDLKRKKKEKKKLSQFIYYWPRAMPLAHL